MGYRLASASHGVFVNPALTEPFGLTLIEAAACGLGLLDILPINANKLHAIRFGFRR